MNHFFLYFQQVKFIGNQNRSTGNSSCELTNLPITIGRGNVLTSISDLVYPMSSGGTDVDYYQVGINQVTDYSPFGVQLDGRTISGGIASNSYRYSFQGQEHDDEIKGEGNSLNRGSAPIYNLIGTRAGYIMGNIQQAVMGREMNKLENSLKK